MSLASSNHGFKLEMPIFFMNMWAFGIFKFDTNKPQSPISMSNSKYQSTKHLLFEFQDTKNRFARGVKFEANGEELHIGFDTPLNIRVEAK